MAGRLWLGILAILACSCATCRAAAPVLLSDTIGYQLHSFNDVRQWRQLILKGGDSAVFFKIDGHYGDPTFCASQKSLVNNGRLDARGCFVLVHDPPVAKQQYFNSHDVLDFVADPENAPLLRKKSASDDLPPVLLYFSWKCDETYPPVNGEHVNSLRNEWMRNLSSVISVNKLDVAVVSGCEGQPDAWCPDTPDFENPSSCMYVANTPDCVGTEVLNCEANPIPFNPPSKILRHLCTFGYGRFANASTAYPWVFYEPSDQGSVFELLDAYLDCGIMAPKGFRVAINIDPTQFQVTAATKSGIGLNEHLLQSFTLDTVKVAVAVCPSAVHHIVAFTENTTDGRLSHSYATAVSQPSGRAGLNKGPRALPTGDAFLAPIASFTAGPTPGTFVVSDGSDAAVVLAYDCATETLSIVSRIKLSDAVSNVYGLAALSSDKAGGFTIVYASTGSDCALYVGAEMASFSEISSIASGVCVLTSGNVTSASISATHLSSTKMSKDNDVCYQSGINGSAIAAVALSYSTSDSFVSVALLCIDAAAGVVRLASGPIPMGPGVETSISILSSVAENGQVVVAIAECHTGGFCFNSDWNNKRSFPLVCDATPTSMASVMNYNVGLWSDFVAQKETNVPHSTPCGSVVHGTYDLGTKPSVALYTRIDDSGISRLAISEVHDGFPTGAVDCHGCGFPNPFDGIVLDAWPLPSYMADGLQSVVSSRHPPMLFASADADIVQPASNVEAVDKCIMCIEVVQVARVAIQHDYALVAWLCDIAQRTCGITRLILGGGDKTACENFIFMYGPEIVVEALSAIFDSNDCKFFKICPASQSKDAVSGNTVPSWYSRRTHNTDTPQIAPNDGSLPGNALELSSFSSASVLSVLCDMARIEGGVNLSTVLEPLVDAWVVGSRSRIAKVVAEGIMQYVDAVCSGNHSRSV